MGALLGLGAGLGLLLMYSAFALPREPPTAGRGPGRVEALLVRAGVPELTASRFLVLCAGGGLLGGLVAQLATGTPPVAVAVGVMVSWVPVALVRSRARRREREYAEVWPDAIDDLASAVRAGLSLPEALGALGVRGPAPLREPFHQFALDYQVTGRFGECLDRLKLRLADPVGDRVVEGLRIAREVGGGDLGRLLRNLGTYLRDAERTRSELEARQSWSVNGARMAVAAPWLVLLFMTFQPSVIRHYATPGGALVLTLVALLCIVSYRLMLRIGRLPGEVRILG